MFHMGLFYLCSVIKRTTAWLWYSNYVLLMTRQFRPTHPSAESTLQIANLKIIFKSEEKCKITYSQHGKCSTKQNFWQISFTAMNLLRGNWFTTLLAKSVYQSECKHTLLLKASRSSTVNVSALAITGTILTHLSSLFMNSTSMGLSLDI